MRAAWTNDKYWKLLYFGVIMIMLKCIMYNYFLDEQVNYCIRTSTVMTAWMFACGTIEKRGRRKKSRMNVNGDLKAHQFEIGSQMWENRNRLVVVDKMNADNQMSTQGTYVDWNSCMQSIFTWTIYTHRISVCNATLNSISIYNI